MKKLKHKYNLLNPYNGGTEAIFYTEEAQINLIRRKNMIKSKNEFLQLIFKNPIRPN